MRILYIDIDALRPDRLGCYGYHRNTSPHIDRLAAEGVRFDEYYTPDAPCLPSRTAMYSGRFGIQTGVVGHGGAAAERRIEAATRGFRDRFGVDGLAARLQQAGLHTTMISPFGQRHSAWWFYAGFHEMHNTGFGGMESAEQIDPVVFPWLERNAARDGWFLHVNFWDVHTPYRVPGDYGEPFAGDPLPRWLDDESLIRRHVGMAGPHTAMDFSMYDDREDPRFPRQPGRIDSVAAMRRMVDGYDTALRYVDDRVGRVVAMLKQAGVYDQTAIIISADHGENFGELGVYGEHGTADAATCRVPMIVKWPGARSGAVDGALRYNLDLAPTLMELLDRPSPAIWDGRSFAGALRGATPGREDLVLSQCCHVCQRSARWDRWLYMRTYHDGFHTFPQEMLYDLGDDPHEQRDLAAANPAVCREGAWRLSRWHDEQMARLARLGGDVVDPLWTVIAEGGPFHARLTSPGSPGSPAGLMRYLERLERTGRAEGAAMLRARYARELAGA